ncbi:heavy metal translocating P-type ATPase [Propylenella binzhouense]|uniref:heavy metal translocating P-type ATPase n=1 Tax=Propylenella binzhouense TaxID=2555902 RepID=UPI0031B5A3A3
MAIALAGLLAGTFAAMLGEAAIARWAWGLAVIPVLTGLLVEILTSLRRGEVGLDLIAALAMAAALLLGEPLAGLVVALMYSGGQFLETYAGRRARRELAALLARVPHTAALYRDGALVEVPLEAIGPGDRVLVRQGDVVPADGVLASGAALLDQSALTGESMPVRRGEGEDVLSGAINADGAFDLRVARPAAESTMAGIVRLVAAAEASKAPMVRLADRYALVFLALTVGLTAAAWLASGDPRRALAVLVIATPCPLILAVPIALIAGVSRAARRGILVKGAAVLEALAAVGVLVVDKTGTLTTGRAELVGRADLAPDPDAALGLAASLELASRNPVAEAIVRAARARGLPLVPPSDVREEPGLGIAGNVGGHAVVVGRPAFVAERVVSRGGGAARRAEDHLSVAVGIDGDLAEIFYLADRVRPEARDALGALRRLGFMRAVLATGDRRAVAEPIARELGFDAVHAELAPEAKVAIVTAERAGGRVMMVGDGVNDAPALAAADVGVAMGGHGAAASAEAADVVLLADDLARLAAGVSIARDSLRIARQSVFAGIGLSTLGMIAAALGHIPPIQGALIQEAIDLAVILNALRALGGGSGGRPGARSG